SDHRSGEEPPRDAHRVCYGIRVSRWLDPSPAGLPGRSRLGVRSLRSGWSALLLGLAFLTLPPQAIASPTGGTGKRAASKESPAPSPAPPKAPQAPGAGTGPAGIGGAKENPDDRPAPSFVLLDLRGI